MEKRYDILMVGIQPWDIEIGSNFKNMAMELSLHHRILYINSPLDFSSKLKRKADPKIKKRIRQQRKELPSLEKINTRLWTYTPPITLWPTQFLPPLLFKWVNRLNNARLARYLSEALGFLEFEEFIILNDSDMFRSYHLDELLSPQAYIYYSRDNLMTVPYWKKHGQKYEADLMRKADCVISNSPYLTSIASKQNRNSYFIGQGCDLDYYNGNKKYPKPKEYNHLKGKILLYTGLLSSRRLDLDLIEQLALSSKDLDFVLLGPEENCFLESRLHQIDNIHFLGFRPPHELAPYIAHADVCFNPQCFNELTAGNYPRKIDEYLAMGKPIVTTNTPTMTLFGDLIYRATNLEEFKSCIYRALREDNNEQKSRRQELAQQHSWRNCIKQLWNFCLPHIKTQASCSSN